MRAGRRAALAGMAIMPTKRRPKRRALRPQISPEAVRLFVAMERIKCTCSPRHPQYAQCDGCEEWSQLEGKLYAVLGLAPFFCAAVEHPDAPTREPDEEARARWRMLKAAAVAAGLLAP